MDVSVIIPAYNAEHTIAASIASVLGAKGDYQLEILVVDDLSTDGTWAKLLELAALHPELKPFKNNRRKGPSGARNTGLDSASGQYIAFLDADDVWYSNHLQLGVGFLQQHQNIDAIMFDQDVIDAESGKRLPSWFTEKKIIRQLQQLPLSATEFAFADNLLLALLEESFLHLQALLLKRVALGNIQFDENVFRSEDVDFGIHLYLAGCRFAYSKVATGIYYENSASLTSPGHMNDIKTATDAIFILNKYAIDSQKYKIPKSMIKTMVRDRLLRIAYAQRKQHNKIGALKSVLQSFSHGLGARQFKELLKVIGSFLLPC